MIKPLKQYVFKYVQGVWKDVLGDSKTLADILTYLDIQTDDHMTFAKYYYYDENYCIWYRVHSNEKITIEIWKIDSEKKCLHKF